MPTLVHLTRHDDEPVVVNADQVVYLQASHHEGIVKIRFGTDRALDVKGDLNTITDLLAADAPARSPSPRLQRHDFEPPSQVFD